MQAYISQNDFRTCNCEFILRNSEKKVNWEKSQNWEIKVIITFVFFNSLPETSFHTLPIILDDRIILWQCILGLNLWIMYSKLPENEFSHSAWFYGLQFMCKPMMPNNVVKAGSLLLFSLNLYNLIFFTR